MRFRIVLLAALPFLIGACQKSEIADKPAAEVSTAPAHPAGDAAPDGSVQAEVIKDRSSIEFVGAKVTRDHQGKFNAFDGTITYSDGVPSAVSFAIDLSSVETDTARLTDHLKSADFFDVARYPKATFTSTSLTPIGSSDPAAASGATHQLRGTLDLHGVTKEVAFPVTAERTAEGVRTRSEFTINRHDWGISYRGAVDDLIRDDVLIRLDLLFPPPAESV